MAFTTPSSYALLVAAHLLGFFAAGLGLGANNILLKLSPKENNAVYLAAFSSLSAVAAALGPVAGGLLMKLFHNFSLDLHLVVLDDVKVVFLAAFVLRLLSLLSFFAVREPKAEPVGRMIRVVWNEVNLNPFEGFGQMVQQWMAPPVSRRTSSGAEYPIPPSEFDESPKPPKIEDESLFPF
jgi:MFS family permease